MKPVNYNLPKIFEYVVNEDLCIGCGVCVALCEPGALTVVWNKYGNYEPKLAQRALCNECDLCLVVCPFSSGSGSNLPYEDENSLATDLFRTSTKNTGKYIGQYRSLHAGYAYEHRETSSSGGIASWVLCKMLRDGLVDRVCAVAPNADSDSPFFKYTILKNVDEVMAASKTRYYPAEMSEVIKTVLAVPGSYAVVTLPCMAKALRLAQKSNPVLQERVKFVVGIICGGLKTAHYTEYLAALAGVQKQNIRQPEYRIKKPDSTAGDYCFGCVDESTGSKVVLSMKKAGDMWGTGLFKPNACDYCDDLSAELADLSVGDAWISPYRDDGRGTSVIISRSLVSEQLLSSGAANNEILLLDEGEDRIVLSQRGNLNHRRTGLAFRLYWAQVSGLHVPLKRVIPKRPYNPLLSMLHKTRMELRKSSQDLWVSRKDGSAASFQLFQGYIARERRKLRRLSQWLSVMRLSKWPSIAFSAFKKIVGTVGNRS